MAQPLTADQITRIQRLHEDYLDAGDAQPLSRDELHFLIRAILRLNQDVIKLEKHLMRVEETLRDTA